MKKSFILLACLALIAGSVMAQQVATVSPDLARHEINSGKVKRITFNSSPDKIVINFDKAGKQLFDKSFKRIKRDKKGRVTVLSQRIEYDFEEQIFSYVGNANRVAFHSSVGGYISPLEDGTEEFNGDGAELYHYYYTGSVNHPSSCVWNMGQDVYYQYATYTYLNFDQFGNWTKRKITYYYITEKIPHQTYYSLGEKLFDAKTEQQRIKIEAKLIPLIKKYSTKETVVETRKIEYYK